MSHTGQMTPANPTPVRVDQDEDARLAELASYHILDSRPEKQFDSIVALARVLFDTPIAAITLVDRDRQWFKAREGLAAEQTAREHSFCSHAMRDGGVFVVPDARADPRFADNPLVRGDPKIRFYAGAPLRGAAGHDLGALCIISPDPRAAFSATDKAKLELLARIVGSEMELRKHALDVRQQLNEQESVAREAHAHLRNSLEYATLLAEVQSAEVPTVKLAAVARAAWQQYSEAGGILMSSIKALRARMTPEAYKALLETMPGFAI